ncbi:MAG: hypothetical protein AB7M12_08780 [Hyphomonadaceae bacterium]
MDFDLSKVVSQLGENAVAQCGDAVGLTRDQSIKVAHALAANFSKGKDEAVKAAAETAGLAEEVTSSMLTKLIDVGKEKLLSEGPVGQALDSAKDSAMAALNDAGGEAMKNAGGFFSKLFGKK